MDSDRIEIVKAYKAMYSFLEDNFYKYETELEEYAIRLLFGDMWYEDEYSESHDPMCFYFYKKHCLSNNITFKESYDAMIAFLKEYIEPWDQTTEDTVTILKIIKSLENNREENEEKYRKYLLQMGRGN